MYIDSSTDRKATGQRLKLLFVRLLYDTKPTSTRMSENLPIIIISIYCLVSGRGKKLIHSQSMYIPTRQLQSALQLHVCVE